MFSESFQIRAPRRQSKFKIRGKTAADRRWTISDRPPAQLPSEALDSIPEDQVEESSTSRPRLASLGDSSNSSSDPIYDCVRDLNALWRNFDIPRKGLYNQYLHLHVCAASVIDFDMGIVTLLCI